MGVGARMPARTGEAAVARTGGMAFGRRGQGAEGTTATHRFAPGRGLGRGGGRRARAGQRVPDWARPRGRARAPGASGSLLSGGQGAFRSPREPRMGGFPGAEPAAEEEGRRAILLEDVPFGVAQHPPEGARRAAPACEKNEKRVARSAAGGQKPRRRLAPGRRECRYPGLQYVPVQVGKRLCVAVERLDVLLRRVDGG